jgi:hypothetical protein
VGKCVTSVARECLPGESESIVSLSQATRRLGQVADYFRVVGVVGVRNQELVARLFNLVFIEELPTVGETALHSIAGAGNNTQEQSNRRD